MKPTTPLLTDGFLSPIPNLQFHPLIHRYKYKDRWVPFSVSRIKGYDDPPEKLQRIAETKHIWLERGNQVHAALEAFLIGDALPTNSPYEEWITPLLMHPLLDGQWKCIASEHRMVDRSCFYAGTLDCLFTNGKSFKLVDLKTQSRKNAAPYSTDVQLGAYCQLLEQNHGIFVDQCVTLWARPGTTAQTVAEPEECRQAWTDCLDQFKRQLPDF